MLLLITALTAFAPSSRTPAQQTLLPAKNQQCIMMASSADADGCARSIISGRRVLSRRSSLRVGSGIGLAALYEAVARWSLLVPSAIAEDAPPPVDDGEAIFTTPTGDLLFILNAQSQLNEVSNKLGKDTYQPSDEDRIAILQLVGFSFKPTALLLGKMSERFGSMRALSSANRAKAAEIALRFREDLETVVVKCRERAPPAEQTAALKAASATLDDFLTVAQTKFQLPVLEKPPGGMPLL